MKTKLFYNHLLSIITFILICGCKDKELVTPNSAQIEYLSFHSNGCISKRNLLKIADEAILQWNYFDGKLTLEVFFKTHCSASMKDSVLLENMLINLFLWDTSSVAAKCICPHKEVFDFRINETGEYKIIFSYKPYSKTEYFLLVDTTIVLY